MGNHTNSDVENGFNRDTNKDSIFDILEELEEKDHGEDIPGDMEVLTNQVAGHSAKETGIVGMLKKDDKVYKPLLRKECAEREISLYENLQSTFDSSLIEMRKLVPKYYGVEKLIIKGNNIDFLILENLTKDFKEPCIMDIKIGKRTWDPDSNYVKMCVEKNKYFQCKRDLSFCIPGFQVYQMANNQLVKFDKEYGKSLDKDGAIEAIKVFLNADSQPFCRPLLVQFLASLWQIQHFARNQRRFRLYATSVLLVYDARRLRDYIRPQNVVPSRPLIRQGSLYRPLSLATLNNGCEKIRTGFSGQLTTEGPILKAPSNRIVNLDGPRSNNNNNAWQKSIRVLKRTHSFQNNYDKDVQNRKQNYTYMLDDLCTDIKSEVWANAKMIDFAHVFPAYSVEVDQNYLEGIDSLIRIFEDFLAQATD